MDGWLRWEEVLQGLSNLWGRFPAQAGLCENRRKKWGWVV